MTVSKTLRDAAPWLAVLVVTAALQACQTAADPVAADNLAKRYVGTRAADFFARHGKPLASQPVGNGKTVYRWQQRELGVVRTLPPVQRYQPGDPRYNPATRVPPRTLAGPARECTVRLVVDPGGIIRELVAVRDTPGERSDSYCREVL